MLDDVNCGVVGSLDMAVDALHKPGAATLGMGGAVHYSVLAVEAPVPSQIHDGFR